MAAAGAPFGSVLGGGFECSSHIGWHGRRLDLPDSTGHLRHALGDYRALRAAGLRWARDGIVWNNIQPFAGTFHWDAWTIQLERAEAAGVLVLWDLLHFGLPPWVDPWGPGFSAACAALATEAAAVHRRVTGRPGIFCPINEMSFWAFGGGAVRWMTPLATDRGDVWKQQLVLAAIAMARAIRQTDSGARLIWAEPLIGVTARDPAQQAEAARLTEAQYECYDWLLGLARPELGGSADLADWLGFNFYPHNQRCLSGGLIGFGMAGYRSLAALLEDCARRYPLCRMLLTETGAEGSARAAWLSYIAEEVRLARLQGMPVDGICLYPITDYPGWDDDRFCPTGLFGMADEHGRRTTDTPYLEAIHKAELRLGGSRPPLSLAGCATGLP